MSENLGYKLCADGKKIFYCANENGILTEFTLDPDEVTLLLRLMTIFEHCDYGIDPNKKLFKDVKWKLDKLSNVYLMRYVIPCKTYVKCEVCNVKKAD